VNLALAAIDHFNRFLGLGPAIVTRERLAQSAPRAQDEDQQRDLVRAAEDASARDRAIVVLLLHTGLRLSELVALDVGDVRTSARKGVVIVRSGKGDAFREVALNPTAREVVDAWSDARKKVAVDGEPALWVGRGGRRLTARAVDLVVRRVAAGAGLQLSAHVLRHTCITKLVRGGSDVVLVAEIAGHRRLFTLADGEIDTLTPAHPWREAEHRGRGRCDPLARIHPGRARRGARRGHRTARGPARRRPGRPRRLRASRPYRARASSARRRDRAIR
jgi:integrase